MPSFSVNRGSFSHFLCSSITNQQKERRLYLKFIMYTVLILMVNVCINAIVFGLENYLAITFPDWSTHVHMLYIWRSTQALFHVVYHCSILCILSSAFYKFNILKQIINGNIKIILLVLFWVLTCWGLCISIIIGWKETDHIYLFSKSSALSNIFYRHYFSLELVSYGIIVPISSTLILHLPIFPFVNHCDRSVNYKIQSEMEIIKLPAHLSDRLLETDDHEHRNDGERHSNCQKIMVVAAFYLIYVCSLIIYYFEGFFKESIKAYFTVVIWIYILYMSLLKKMLKYLANIIDSLHQSDKFISLAYLMEAYVSAMYLYFVKYYVSYHITDNGLLIMILLSHFLTEMIETNVHFTEFYFDLSSNAIDFWKRHSNVNCVFAGMYKLTRDESNLNEWRVRLSLDMYTRFVVSILSTFSILIQFWSAGRSFLNEYGIDYDLSMRYTLIYGAMDLIHYTITILISEHCFKFSIMKTCICYLQSFEQREVMLLLIVYVSCSVLLL